MKWTDKMILNRNLYSKVSTPRIWWNLRQLKKLMGEKVFRAFHLHKTEWPNKLYFYSPRLKRIPRFTGNKELLAHWKDSKICETICPTQAIKVTASAIIIEDRGCIACGLCLEVAPPGLLEMTPELLDISV
jgi:Fe-S-cluster-containing hydrogenase component 2